MTVFKSAIDTKSKAFRDNAKALGALVADLQAKVSEVKEGGGKAAREKHLARGKLLPRECPASGSGACSTPGRRSWS
jgi:3-methylcrotonyl-CoA carboxylase beta subunit